MANPNDVREIVKDAASYYRATEEARQKKEDYNHKHAPSPAEKSAEAIINEPLMQR